MVPNPNGPIEELARWYWENHRELHQQPALLNYHKDWLASAEFQSMSLAQRGAYTTLVFYGAASPIPKRMVLKGLGVANGRCNWNRWIFPAIKDHFIEVSPDYYQNKRVMKEMAKRAKERARKRGK